MILDCSCSQTNSSRQQPCPTHPQQVFCCFNTITILGKWPTHCMRNCSGTSPTQTRKWHKVQRSLSDVDTPSNKLKVSDVKQADDCSPKPPSWWVPVLKASCNFAMSEPVSEPDSQPVEHRTCEGGRHSVATRATKRTDTASVPKQELQTAAYDMLWSSLSCEPHRPHNMAAESCN